MNATFQVAPIDILLIEDNPGDVRLAREALQESKIQNDVHVVTDGRQAIAFLRKEGEYADALRPDLILLDLNLPWMDGREVLAEIKADAKLRRIPVVVLTVSKAEEYVLQSYDLHANCYLTKPIDMGQFMKLVHSINNFWLSIVKLPPK